MSSSSVAGIWPWATATFSSGTSDLQEIMDFREVGKTRADVEALAAAIMLAHQRLADDQRIEGRDEGAHRHAVDRRRGDQRQFAHAGQGKLQRARDRCCRQRQHMHIGFQLLQPLLVLDAEMLFLVDDQQAEIGEIDRGAEQRMGADDDIGLALGDFLLGQRQFLGADKARRLRNAHRQAAETIGEGLEMLTGQQRRRHDDGHLNAVHRGDEGRAQRDFRLAETDVAANEAIHRPAGAEIVANGLDRS